MNLNILDLPSEILVLICEQIKIFNDRKNFARAHPKLWKAFVYLNRKEVQSEICFGNEKDYKYVKHWNFILEWWGSNLTSIDNIDGFVDSGELVEVASKFCPSLEQIAVEFREANIKKLEENMSKLGMIKDIKMHAHLNSKQNNCA